MALLKPDICKTCVLYGSGDGYVPDKLDPDASVLVITMNPTQHESQRGYPREGAAVTEYESQYEKYAGPIAKSYANVIRCRGQRGTVLPTGKRLAEGVKHCRTLDVIQSSIKLVVMVGQDVVKSLRPDIKNASRWRGFLIPESREAEAVSNEDI